MNLTETAKNAIRENTRVMARLMMLFNRGSWSIVKWVKANDPRLASPASLEIIQSETGYGREQLVECQMEFTEKVSA